jgi:ferredoxin
MRYVATSPRAFVDVALPTTSSRQRFIQTRRSPTVTARVFGSFTRRRDDAVKEVAIVPSESSDVDDDERRPREWSRSWEEGDDIPEALTNAIPSCYYTLLQVEPSAGREEIKQNFRQLLKATHPDVAGEASVEISRIMNDAYKTLLDDVARELYDRDLAESRYAMALAGERANDEFKPYTGEALSKFVGSDPTGQSRAVFVNESVCIGCRMCNHSAAKTFMMEQDYGRARAFQQWADTEEDIQIAIDSCPVDCISWVKKTNLPILEYAMQTIDRINIASMRAGNARGADPFDIANGMIRRGEEARARLGDSGDTLNGIATVGSQALAIREAWLLLNESTRARWRTYAFARASVEDSYDECDDIDCEVPSASIDEDFA